MTTTTVLRNLLNFLIIILFRYAVPLIKEKAFLFAMKGGDLTDEFAKAELKYKSYIKKSTVYDLHYKP